MRTYLVLTNRTRGTTIRNMKENAQTILTYISLMKTARKQEFCTIVKVNEYYNRMYFR